MRKIEIGLGIVCALAVVSGWAGAQEWNFADGNSGQWVLNNAKAGGKGPGLDLTCENDPQMMLDTGETFTLPAGSVMEVKMSASAGSIAQIFWGGSYNEKDSLTAPITADGKVHVVKFTFPKELNVERLRFDPTEGVSQAHIESIVLPITRFSMKLPAGPFVKGAPGAEIKSGGLRLAIDTAHWATFDVYVAGADGKERLAATSLPNDVLRLAGGATTDLSAAKVSWDKEKSTLSATLSDADGVNWTFSYAFAPAKKEGGVSVTFSATAEKDRAVLRLPVMGLLAGNGSFGAKKNQGLFAGLEYLVDEPSSNQLDITGGKSRRYIPDPVKITFPLMAIQAEGIYVGLMWPGVRAAAFFDSPSRMYEGACHTMALSKPAVGEGLPENGLFATTPLALHAGQPLTLTATIIGGAGTDATAAVKHYLAAQPLPKPPELPRDDNAAVALFTDAYTTSEAAKGGVWRHAVWGNSFGPQPAADVCAYLKWLSTQSTQENVIKRAEDGIAAGAAKLPDGDYLGPSVSHVVPPAAPLIFGHLESSLPKLRDRTMAVIKTMNPDGTFTYDGHLARTHFEKQANGYAADKVLNILNAARLLGDEDILAAGLKGLDAMSRFDGHVPRGAQTWEIPLHTPDIMGAGRAVEAFLLGYDFTGKQEYLDRAIYWAWTGVPFVYLEAPVPGKPIGLYATIAVYGGTNWGEPFWIGQPVQWCGLTYSYPLFHLAEYDKNGPWRTIAEGITISGMQQQWPESDKGSAGLFPDFFHLYEQTRDGPRINPGAVFANYIYLRNKPPLYSFAREAKSGVFINAPAKIADVSGEKNHVSFKTSDVPWKDPYYVLLAHGGAVKTVNVDGAEAAAADAIDTAAAPAWKFDAKAKRLIVKVKGNATVKIGME